jgi:hypothetical protein
MGMLWLLSGYSMTTGLTAEEDCPAMATGRPAKVVNTTLNFYP